MMACSTAPQFSFPRTTSSTSPSQILMGSSGQSTTSAQSAPGIVPPPVVSVGSGVSSTPRGTPSAPPPSSSSSRQSSPPGVPHPSAVIPASSSASSTTTGSGAGGATGATPAAGGGGCCESGRPILTDPVSGQTVCSCQYDAAQLLGYQRLAAAAAAAAAAANTAALPAGSSMYATAAAPYPPSTAAAAAAAVAAAAEQGAYLPLSAADQSAFYSPTANGFDLKENLEAWRSLAAYPSAMYYPYESPLAGYPFANGYGVDLNGARRKNATRETTSTLKAWLSEHRKNPYPTKGEKIMLAIITKMTLTQVSTWFANARRRLKKENKMTWEPRNRCDDDDDDMPNNDGSTNDNMCNSGDEDHSKDDELDVGDNHSDIDCKDDGILDVDDSMKCPPHPLIRLQQQSTTGHGMPSSTSSSTTTTTTPPTKPRIWSIVDTATSSDDKSTSSSRNNNSIPTSMASRSRLQDYPPPPTLAYHPVTAKHSAGPMPSWYPGIYSPETSSRIPVSFHNGLIYSAMTDRRSSPPPLLQPQLPLRHRIPPSTASSSPPSSPETTKNATENL